MQSKHPDDIEKNRKLLAPNDVALCLITLLDRNNEELAKAVEALDRDLVLKILREALYLRIFAVDYGTSAALGRGQLRVAVLDAFLAFFQQAEADGAFEAGSYRNYCERVSTYCVAMPPGNAGDVLLEIGRRFCTSCGIANNLRFAWLAAMQFGGVQKAAREFIESYKIEAS